MNIKVSIVLLTYNNLYETTKPCIESILKYTNPKDYELIIVDNYSTDLTPSFLTIVSKKYSNVILQLNDTNKGYAGGNNDGIKLATGEFIILLNNDTLVTQDWLKHLLEPFSLNHKIGLVGPISNNVGNEQRVLIPKLNEDNYNELSAEYCSHFPQNYYLTKKLGFFCVAIKKEAIEKIGLLDENFGIGMFEDDDYCIRALQARFLIAITERCFIYHKGSVSFKKLDVAEYRHLFNRNKQYFFTKNLTQWTLTDLAISYLEKFKHEMEHSSVAQNPKELLAIKSRLEHFWHLLHQMKEQEIAQSANVPDHTTSQTLTRYKWQRRRENFHINFWHGTFNQRKAYFFNITSKIFPVAKLKKLVERPLRKMRHIRSRLTGDLTPQIAFQDKPSNHIAKLFKKLDLRKVIVFPPTIDFTYMHQRPQQLATALARSGYTVIYGTRNHLTDKVESAKLAPNTKNLIIYNANYFSLLHHFINPVNSIFYCIWPMNYEFLNQIPANTIIYDYLDDLSLLDRDQEMTRDQHQILLDEAKFITVSSEELYRHIPDQYKHKTEMMKNACDPDIFKTLANADRKKLPKHGKKTIVGYFGALAEWIDFDLLYKMLDRRPDIELIVIGPIFKVEEQIARLKFFGNFKHVDTLPHQKLMERLVEFEICIIPFIKSKITDAVSPVKLFEYMAAGKPIITAGLLEAKNYDNVFSSETHEEFIENLDKAIRLKDDDNFKQEVYKMAHLNTWDARIETLIKRINH
jgi:GT2 family glycosyltransferase